MGSAGSMTSAAQLQLQLLKPWTLLPLLHHRRRQPLQQKAKGQQGIQKLRKKEKAGAAAPAALLAGDEKEKGKRLPGLLQRQAVRLQRKHDSQSSHDHERQFFRGSRSLCPSSPPSMADNS